MKSRRSDVMQTKSTENALALVSGWRFVVHEPLMGFRLGECGQARSTGLGKTVDFVGTRQQAYGEAARRARLFERHASRTIRHLEVQRVELLHSFPLL